MLVNTSAKLGLRHWSLNSIWRVRKPCQSFVQMESTAKSSHKYFFVLCSESQSKTAFTNKDSVQRELTSAVSQKVCLSCDVSDTKAEVKWYKDGKLLHSSKTVHVESKGKSRQLVIDSVEIKDGGEYVCEAAGDKLLFKVHVEGRAIAACCFRHIWCLWVFFVSLCNIFTFFYIS